MLQYVAYLFNVHVFLNTVAIYIQRYLGCFHYFVTGNYSIIKQQMMMIIIMVKTAYHIVLRHAGIDYLSE